MQIRTFLTILGALALVAFLAIFGKLNQLLLDQPFLITPTRSVPLWTVMVGAYLVGVLTFLTVFLLRGSADLVERWRLLRGRRAGRAVDEIYNRGMEAILEGRDEKALEHFQSILSLDAEHFQALVRGGAVLRSLKRFAEAVDLHKRAHRLRDAELEPLYELVKDYEAMDQVGKAKVVLNRIIQLRPRRALSAYRKLRKYAIAEADWARAWELQGLIEDQMEKTPYKLEAERRYSIGIRYEMACAAARERHDKDALNALRKLAKSDPGFVPAHLKLGEVLKTQGHAEQAVHVWEGGFAQTGAPVFLSRIEERFLADEDPEGAIRAAQEAVARSRKDFLPRFFLARLYLRLEMIDEAYREFNSLSARASSSPTLHACLGAVLERRGAHREAAAEYRQIITDLEYLKLQYRCQVCDERYAEWSDRCRTCGEWNQVALDFGEDPTLEDLGLSPGPVYSQTA
ncbi:MAG TPA: tetratricopeptide repeat protein [Candidatus Polarisedimenticolia bacterium]|jgi:lipopolysaccharide biosynthesis regulator YciM